MNAIGDPIADLEVEWFDVLTATIIATGITGADGHAAHTWVLDGLAGSQELLCTVVGIGSETFTAVATPDVVSQLLLVAGDGQTANASATFAALLEVRAEDRFNNAVATATVDWNISAGTLTASNTTDDTGLATNRATAGTAVGSITATATCNGHTVVFNESVASAGMTATSIVVISGQDPANIVAGSAATALILEVRDQNTTAMQGVTVNASNSARGTLNQQSAVTPSSGRVTFTLQTFTLIETDVITISAPGLTGDGATSTITTIAGAQAAIEFLQFPASNGASGQPLTIQPILRMTDINTNPVTTATANVVCTVSTSVSGTLVLASGGTVAMTAGTAVFTALTLTGANATGYLQFARAAITINSPLVSLTSPVPDSIHMLNQPGGNTQGQTFSYSAEIYDSVNGLRVVNDNSSVVIATAVPSTTVLGATATAAAGLLNFVSSIAATGTFSLVLAPSGQVANIDYSPAVLYQTWAAWGGNFEPQGPFSVGAAVVVALVDDAGCVEAQPIIGVNGGESAQNVWTTYPGTATWTNFDLMFDNWIAPYKTAIEANTETLVLCLRIGGQVATMPTGFVFGDMVLDILNHLNTTYAIEPELIQVRNEPANSWAAAVYADACIGAMQRARGAGFNKVKLSLPTLLRGQDIAATSYVTTIVNRPGFDKLWVGEVCWHNYAGITNAQRTSNYTFINTLSLTNAHNAMDEHNTADYLECIADIKFAHVSTWMKDGSSGLHATNPIISIAANGLSWVWTAGQEYLWVMGRHIRPGMRYTPGTSSDPNITDVQVWIDGTKYCVVARFTAAATIIVPNLPAGTYYPHYTTASQSRITGSGIVIAAGENLSFAMPAAGMLALTKKQ